MAETFVRLSTMSNPFLLPGNILGMAQQTDVSWTLKKDGSEFSDQYNYKKTI